ncbi:ATP synthase-coupling factor 6, mitochondrial-like [Mya arenaria]|uniref:ATP synthase-coupling factor 6, mitochondrial-like n=1 Tax=Mya arenaria TaxID=6604 RepID=UPI0022E0FF73|nr:ATP synthase-coupling factor 6, mitochondrial-like [Mya arenaria]
MLTSVCRSHIRRLGLGVHQHVTRNIGSTAILAQEAKEPIQQLFVQKIKEFDQKKKAAGGKMQLSAEAEASLKSELARLEAQFQAAGKDMTAFPSFSFSDQPLERPPQPEMDNEKLPL